MFKKYALIPIKKWLRFFFLVLCISTSVWNTFSQTARPDNVFVTPGGTASWNVVKNDDPGICNYEDIWIEIPNEGKPKHARSYSVNNSTKKISYRPANGYIGWDTLTYKISCPDSPTSSQASVYINVSEKPDNMFVDLCHVPFKPLAWGLKSEESIDKKISTYQIPLVADIDGDGIVEIVVCYEPDYAAPTTGIRFSQKVAIFKGNDIVNGPHLVFNTISKYNWMSGSALGIVKTIINEEEKTLIIVTENSLPNADGPGILRAYDSSGNLVWTSNEYFNEITSMYAQPCFVDFNHDGIPEIIVRDKIFDSATGVALCTAPRPNAASTTGAVSTIAADILHNGDMKLVLGTRVYDVVIKTNDPTNPLFSQNKVTLRNLIKIPNTYPTASSISPVDLDNDGKLEFVVASTKGGTIKDTWIGVANPLTGDHWLVYIFLNQEQPDGLFVEILTEMENLR